MKLLRWRPAAVVRHATSACKEPASLAARGYELWYHRLQDVIHRRFGAVLRSKLKYSINQKDTRQHVMTTLANDGRNRERIRNNKPQRRWMSIEVRSRVGVAADPHFQHEGRITRRSRPKEVHEKREGRLRAASRKTGTGDRGDEE